MVISAPDVVIANTDLDSTVLHKSSNAKTLTKPTVLQTNRSKKL